MLKKIENLPANVLGIRAEDKISKEDYETVLIPLLVDAHQRGERIRFLYQLGPEFSGFTVGAAMDDLKVGLKYFRLFSRCAVVSDSELMRNAAQFAGSLMPIPVQSFKNDQLKSAIDWLTSPELESSLKFELRDNGVLIVRPQRALSREDFDKLAAVVDPWIETHHQLNGFVICIKKFPGWENVGSLIHHFEFVKAHHRKVRRVALAVDGALPEIMSKLANHFVEAEIKHFSFENTEEAIKWANG